MTDLQQRAITIKRAIREVYALDTFSVEEVIATLKDIRDQADRAIDDLLLGH